MCMCENEMFFPKHLISIGGLISNEKRKNFDCLVVHALFRQTTNRFFQVLNNIIGVVFDFMSQPDYIDCEYPLPGPEVRGRFFTSVNLIGGYMGVLFKITREGRLDNFNFHGTLRFYGRTESDEFIYYIANFINGQLQFVKRGNFVEFEDESQHPLQNGPLICEDFGPSIGKIYRITKAGQLFDPTTNEDLHFDGDLKFYSPFVWKDWKHIYIARFENGQLKSIEKFENKLVKWYDDREIDRLLPIVCEYPLPEPEIVGKHFLSKEFGSIPRKLTRITKEGRLVQLRKRRQSGDRENFQLSDYELEDLNFHGELKIYRTSPNGEFFLYVTHFDNGQLQLIEKPVQVEFESKADNPDWSGQKLFCDYKGEITGRVLRLTSGGRLVDPQATGGDSSPHARDLNFEGELKLFSDPRSDYYTRSYLANFKSGQLQSIEKLPDKE
jgi:hypothetical protein